MTSAEPRNASPYLDGAAAPVEHEITAVDLTVTGTIPAELDGRWLRNGPNPITAVNPATHHWFVGDGMVHGVRLRDGKAEWYRNRWVRSNPVADVLGEAPPTGPDFSGRGSGLGPNTNVGTFAGKTWAMIEAGGTPTELTYELDTVARNAFDDTLLGPFSAHPKFDPDTGSMHAMCYAWPDLFTDRGLFLHYVIVGPSGQVESTVEIPVEAMPMVHDMSLTKNWAVVFDLPVAVSMDLISQGVTFPFAWDPNYHPRLGLIPRNKVVPGGPTANTAAADAIVWCDVAPCYVFHPLNAYENEAGELIIDVCRYETMFDHDQRGPFGDSAPTLDRWVINPVTRSVTETRIDDRPHEFPRHDPAVSTKAHRYGYTAVAALEDGLIAHRSLYKTDYHTGTLTEHNFGGRIGGAEPVFVPKADRQAEDEGWILSLAYDPDRDTSSLHIIDAQAFDEPAVGIIHLPQRVPLGFHGNWCSDRSSHRTPR